MNWSPQQEEALARVGEWLRSGSMPSFTLAGYAGTGKSTLARHLAAGVVGDVLFVTYTGKAAYVLRKMGNPWASTIHKLIYEPHDKSDEILRGLHRERIRVEASEMPRVAKSSVLSLLDKKIKIERDNLRRPEFSLRSDSPLLGANLCVVDEYSMVGEELGRDLLSFGCRVLALGDPGQLPPVQGRCYFSSEPDYLLTEIHRQAWGSPVIRLSKDAREGKALALGAYGSSRVVLESSLSDRQLRDLVTSHDQILVGLNRTRAQYNTQFRKVLGHRGALPVAGDKLVCLRNDHDKGLLNGQIWKVRRVKDGSRYLDLSLVGEDGESLDCLAHRDHFLGRGDELDPSERRRAAEFDYGYALTVHKAQGSQWDKVLLVDEWYGVDREKWLYTGITRAAESVTVLR